MLTKAERLAGIDRAITVIEAEPWLAKGLFFTDSYDIGACAACALGALARAATTGNDHASLRTQWGVDAVAVNHVVENVYGLDSRERTVLVLANDDADGDEYRKAVVIAALETMKGALNADDNAA